LTTPREEPDVVVVGAGIIGLAVARELLAREPGRTVTVLEREAVAGFHQTGHNSGVLHAGIYYAPGSLKARLSTEGSRELFDYCQQRGLPARRDGKLIVAVSEQERPKLDELERRGSANGVQGLRRIPATEIAEIEPHVRGVEALHSPQTAVVDFRAIAEAFADDVRAAGGEVVTGCAVEAVEPDGRGVRLRHAQGESRARFAVFCAGAWSDRLAVQAGAPAEPRIVPFRGAYLRLKPERRHLVRGLIYPVPDPRLPFLGVHLTRHADGEILVGPTALMAGARDAYRLRDVRARDLRATLAWPGTPRLMRRFWRTGVQEILHAVSRRAMARTAARYVPELRASDLLPGWAGVRAQALWRDGRLVDDFVFSATDRALHVRNAPSPAATSSLAIGRHVADQAEEAFGLVR
jgi:(S)-2-hydroxyglutarate dehydrogenase